MTVKYVCNRLLICIAILLTLSRPVHSQELSQAKAGSDPATVGARKLSDSTHLAEALLETAATGLPATQRFQIGLVGGYGFTRKSLISRIFLDDHTQIGLPQFGAVSTDIDAAVLYRAGLLHATVGAYLNIFGIFQGVEYDFRDWQPRVRMAVDVVLRRGGLNSWADRFRIEYVPSCRELQIGFSVAPYWQRRMRNRPRERDAMLPRNTMNGQWKPDSAFGAKVPLARIDHAMGWIDRYLTPRIVFGALDSKRERKKFDNTMKAIADHSRLSRHTFLEEDSVFHASLVEACAFAAGSDAPDGNQLATLMRECLLGDIVIPVNRLFCQRKRPSQVEGFCGHAVATFRQRLTAEFPSFGEPQIRAAGEIFARVVDRLRQVFDDSKNRWRDSRLIWLPLNFGLTRAQYDSQSEVDSILGLVVGRKMTSANTVSYLLNDAWILELEQMIRQTRYYSVLIVHDIAGQHGRSPDRISWNMVTDSYIRSFINAVHAIDSGRRELLPDYTIFIDEHYFQVKKSRPLLRLLQNLYDPEQVDLSDRLLRQSVDSSLAELRQAIERSPIFGRKSKRELRKLFCVHVNVTNVFEPIYSEDALMRDHRKIAFRDIFEGDPSSGVALFTGQGVGESYVGPSWDDRSLKVQGADLVYLKTAAREIFLSQGFTESKVPYYLRPVVFPADYADRCQQLRERGWTASVLTVMNATGYGPKLATVAKASLYNLMSPGSVIIAPDPLWAGDFWASMCLSAALRGCRVFAICPRRENAPSDASITMESVRETLTCMFEGGEALKDQISAAGGMLRIGLYQRQSDVKDIAESLSDLIGGIQRDSVIQNSVLRYPELLPALTEAQRMCQTSPHVISHLVPGALPDGRPKLHLKAQLFLNNVATRNVSSDVLTSALAYFTQRSISQMSGDTGAQGIEMSAVSGSQSEGTGIGGASGSAPDAGTSEFPSNPSDNRVMYLTLGSQNQDRRSMMLDGEDLAVVGGPGAMVGMIDFAILAGAAHWVTRSDELTLEFRQPGSILKSIVRLVKDVI